MKLAQHQNNLILLFGIFLSASLVRLSRILVPVTLIFIKLLPCIMSEIGLCRKILLSLWQLLKVVIIGQVWINSIPLIISITPGFYTTLCSVRTRNVLPSQNCTQQKWQQK